MEETIETGDVTQETTATAAQAEVKDPQAVLKMNERLLSENHKLKALKVFEGLDIEQVRSALDTVSKLNEQKLVNKGDYDKAKAEYTAAADKKVREIESQFNAFVERNAFKSLQADLTSEQIGVRAQYADDVATILTARAIKPELRDGEIVWVNKDSIGDVADLAALAAELREKKPAYFAANTTAGSGASGNGNNTGAPASAKRSEMSTADKSAFIAKHGQEAFLKLPD